MLFRSSQLEETENKIENSRRYYNANVRDFNTKIETFPNNTVANMLKFKKYDYYATTEQERQNPEVKF